MRFVVGSCMMSTIFQKLRGRPNCRIPNVSKRITDGVGSSRGKNWVISTDRIRCASNVIKLRLSDLAPLTDPYHQYYRKTRQHVHLLQTDELWCYAKTQLGHFGIYKAARMNIFMISPIQLSRSKKQQPLNVFEVEKHGKIAAK